ncbi:porin [Bordetella genomosp. 11]|uniref:Porin n=1 Tax=Bordetella genomosp. 11 TaxID=1416808 RepID=A0A261V101_9BORD|nr:porin [Bordetella genomosp. 11]OZI67200.1 porin [Bordetella genomosp. 11]
MKRFVLFAALTSAALFYPAIASADDDDPPGTHVTLYGLIDLAVASQHTSGQGTSNGLLTGGQTDSLWGMRGKEDLGAGWHASFQLETGFNAADGLVEDDSGRLFNYNAWVGLGRDTLGEVRLGRQSTIGRQFGGELEQAGWKDMGLGSTFKASDNFQFDNTVNYFSPTVGGLKVGLGYSFNADDGSASGFRTANNNRAYSIGLHYEQGPLLAIATWDEMRLGAPVAMGARPRALQLGVAYDFEVVKIAVAWSRQQDGYVGLDGGDPDGLGLGLGPSAFVHGGRVDAWYIGATVPLGPGSLVAQWSPAKPSWSWQDGKAARTAQVATLGYIYPLSPRTSLYTFAGYARNYTLDNQFDPANSHTTRVAVGITHQF